MCYNLAMAIPVFPELTPISIEHKDEIQAELYAAPDGISEFTFSALYLFRNRYDYQVSRLKDKSIIIFGTQPSSRQEEKGKRFFMTPHSAPEKSAFEKLFMANDYWKNIPESILIPERNRFEKWGITIEEDRDNFDYLYLKTDLANLLGKKYHKKRNLVSQFLKLYTHEAKNLTAELIPDALMVLEKWREGKGKEGDYSACREALEIFSGLSLTGIIFYIEGEPAGLCLGETIAQGRIFSVHFEKGLEEYKGIYQFINQAFAASLPEYITYINREQDLGDKGLRQAKMTYRPSCFVRKYSGRMI
jgi:hypothetical protein